MPEKPLAFWQSLAQGLNTRDEPSRLLQGQSKGPCQNVDLSAGTLAKRPGTKRKNATKANSGAAVLAGLEWEHSTAGTKRLIHAGSQFNTADGSWVLTDAGVTADTTRCASFAQVRNLVGIANGGTGGGKNYIHDGTLTQELPAAPAGVGLSNGGAGGLTTGVLYQYKFTFYSSVQLFEGPVSAVFTHTPSAGATAIAIDFTAGDIAYLAGGIWDKIRVYRTTGGGATFKLHTTLATADFTDTLADGSLGAVFVDNGRLKPAAAVAALGHHDRLFLASTRFLYASDVGSIGDFSTGNPFTTESEDSLTALAEHVDTLFWFTDRSYGVLRDVTRAVADFYIQRLSTAYGCVGPHALAKVGDHLWFFDRRSGVCRMDGAGNVEEVSIEIADDLVKNLEQTLRLPFIQMGHNVQRNQVWVAFTPDGGAQNTKLYVCQYDQWRDDPNGIPQPKWTGPYDGIKAASLFEITDTEGVRSIAFGDYAGFVYEANRARIQDLCPSDVANGTATGGGASTLSDTGAAFPTAGSGLLAVQVLIKHAATGTYEVAEILSNTATVLTFTGATAEASASGDSYWIGAYDARWRSGDDRLGIPMFSKRLSRVSFTHRIETHTEPLTLTRYANGAAAAISSTTHVLASPGRVHAPVDFEVERLSLEFRARASLDGFEVNDLAIFGVPSGVW